MARIPHGHLFIPLVLLPALALGLFSPRQWGCGTGCGGDPPLVSTDGPAPAPTQVPDAGPTPQQDAGSSGADAGPPLPPLDAGPPDAGADAGALTCGLYTSPVGGQVPTWVSHQLPDGGCDQ